VGVRNDFFLRAGVFRRRRRVHAGQLTGLAIHGESCAGNVLGSAPIVDSSVRPSESRPK
jgi:hypothetical protein